MKDPKKQAAKMIVRDIVRDLTGRNGLRQTWEGIDGDIRDEIRARWEELAVMWLDTLDKK